ncbi:MAG: SufE family protein [Halobacteriovoraceae bacterium]|nr:SufE family protein [Halobacteriovoraceae bacterium]MCB9095736.1 SufE family protein [Halobacteriovoraceae bacterium]
MSISNKIEEVTGQFDLHQKWEDRYKELINFGKQMPPLEDAQRVEKYMVKGCQSQVWLIPELRDGKIYFQGDSDALIVKGILGLLVKVYSGETPDTILKDRAEFLKDIGIYEHLSMNRTNGLASMLKTIKLYATAYKAMLESQR